MRLRFALRHPHQWWNRPGRTGPAHTSRQATKAGVNCAAALWGAPRLHPSPRRVRGPVSRRPPSAEVSTTPQSSVISPWQPGELTHVRPMVASRVADGDVHPAPRPPGCRSTNTVPQGRSRRRNEVGSMRTGCTMRRSWSSVRRVRSQCRDRPHRVGRAPSPQRPRTRWATMTRA